MVDFKKLRRALIYTTIGIVITAACVSVVAVLVGTINDAISKTYTTLLWSLIHCLLILALVWDDESLQSTYRKLPIFINTLFFILALSFVASLLKIWDIASWHTFNNFYKTFATLAFASLHGEILLKAEKKKNYLDNIIYVNFIFIIIVFCMLQLQIYIGDVSGALAPIYYRLLAATSIIDGTLSILVIIFYRLYKYNNPTVNQGAIESTEMGNPLVMFFIWLLMVYLFFQIVIPLLFMSAIP